MSLGKSAWKETRQRLQELLSNTCSTLKDNNELRQEYVIHINQSFLFFIRCLINLRAFIEQSEAQMHLPAQIGENKLI
jgi:hypothetical protein